MAIAGILTCVQRRSRGPRRRPRRKLWRRSRRNFRSIVRPRTIRPPRTQSSGDISTTTRPENDDSLPHSSGNEQNELFCNNDRPERNEQTTDTAFTSTAGGGIPEKDGSLQNITSHISERLPDLESWRLSLKVSDYFAETTESRSIPSPSKSSAENEFSPNITSRQIPDSGFADTSQKLIASCSGNRDEDCSQNSETASEVECWRLSLNISDYIPETPDSHPEANIPSSSHSSAKNEFSQNTEEGFVRDTSQESIASCSRVEDNDYSQTSGTASEVECWRLSLNVSDFIPVTPESCSEADMPSFSKSPTENEFEPEEGFVRNRSQESIGSCSRVEDNDCSQTSGSATEKETLPFKEEMDILHRLESTGITLEGVWLTEQGSAVIGTILVCNECYEKHVSVRHTANGWQTFQDTSAQWMETIEGEAVDRFRFHLDIPDGKFCMEFAISFNEKWDNNEGKNYSLSCKVFDV